MTKGTLTYYVMQRGWRSFDFSDKVRQGVTGLFLEFDVTLIKQLDIQHIWLQNSKSGPLFRINLAPHLEIIWQSYSKAILAIFTMSLSPFSKKKHIVAKADKCPIEIHNVTSHICWF